MLEIFISRMTQIYREIVIFLVIFLLLQCNDFLPDIIKY